MRECFSTPEFVKKHLRSATFSNKSIVDLFKKKDDIIKSLHEYLSNNDYCNASCDVYDDWFNGLSWRMLETKDLIRTPLFNGYTADQKRYQLMIKLNALSYSHLKKIHAHTMAIYNSLSMRYERLLDVTDYVNAYGLNLKVDKLKTCLADIHQTMIRMCYYLAFHYHDFYNLTFNDAFQIAQLAVTKSSYVYRHDDENQLPFNIYCYYRIFTDFSRNRDVSHKLTLSDWQIRSYEQMGQLIQKYFMIHNTFPSEEHIMNQMGLSKNEVFYGHVYLACQQNDSSNQDVYMQLHQCLSEKARLDEGIEPELPEEEKIINNMSLDKLYNLIDDLEPSMRRVMQALLPHYGEPLSREQLAVEMNISERKVKALRKQAMGILRNHLKDCKLCDFLSV